MNTKLKNKKYYIINAILILLVTGLTIFYLVKNGIFSQLSNLKMISFKEILILCLLVLTVYMIESTIIYRTNKMSNIPLDFKKSTELYFFGNLGSNITPMKAGHFPFMFYHMTQHKIPMNKSLGIVCLNQIIYSTTTIILYLSIFIMCAVKNTFIVVLDITVHLKYIALIGLLFNIGTMTLVFLMSFSRKFHKIIINICSWFLFKCKKITSREDYAKEQTEKMLIYKEQITYFMKHFYKFIPSILLYFCFMFIYCGFPYLIYMFLTGSQFIFSDYLFFFSLNQTMSYITNVIPVPGGTGVAEFSFLTIFGVVYPESLVGAGMIIWRIFTYYLPIVIAFIIFLSFMIRKQAEHKKLEDIKLQKIEKDKNENNLFIEKFGNILTSHEKIMKIEKINKTKIKIKKIKPSPTNIKNFTND